MANQTPTISKTIIVLFGPSGAGKTTIGKALGQYLLQMNPDLYIGHIDGDIVRSMLIPERSWSTAQRWKQSIRLAHLASSLARTEDVVIVTAIMPFAAHREQFATIIGAWRLLMIELVAQESVLALRDSKGLRARGAEQPYEPRGDLKLLYDTEHESPAQIACRIVETDRKSVV